MGLNVGFSDGDIVVGAVVGLKEGLDVGSLVVNPGAQASVVLLQAH